MSDGIPMPAKPAKVYAVPARPGLVNDMREWELIGTTTWMPDTIAEQIGSARHQVDEVPEPVVGRLRHHDTDEVPEVELHGDVLDRAGSDGGAGRHGVWEGEGRDRDLCAHDRTRFAAPRRAFRRRASRARRWARFSVRWASSASSALKAAAVRAIASMSWCLMGRAYRRTTGGREQLPAALPVREDHELVTRAPGA